MQSAWRNAAKQADTLAFLQIDDAAADIQQCLCIILEQHFTGQLFQCIGEGFTCMGIYGMPECAMHCGGFLPQHRHLRRVQVFDEGCKQANHATQ